MKVMKCMLALILVMNLTACASLTRSQKGAALGGAAGAAVGYVLTGGPLGTLAGAAVGGAVGVKH